MLDGCRLAGFDDAVRSIGTALCSVDNDDGAGVLAATAAGGG